MEEIIFSITTETVQNAAQTQINRSLTYTELENVRRGIEYALMSDFHEVLFTAIKNSIKVENSI